MFVEIAILNQVLRILPVLCSDERLKVMGGRHKDYRMMRWPTQSTGRYNCVNPWSSVGAMTPGGLQLKMNGDDDQSMHETQPAFRPQHSPVYTLREQFRLLRILFCEHSGHCLQRAAYSFTWHGLGVPRNFSLLVSSDQLKSICVLEISLSHLESVMFKFCVNLIVT